jgi:uncharacterized membrane protein YbjE (DUF340 family)
MLWKSLWRGQPMIDQPGHLWVVPAVIVTAAFFVGGAIADVGRRLDLNKGLPLPVAELWLYALVGTVVIASLGALFGRRLYLREKKRKRERKRSSPARR